MERIKQYIKKNLNLNDNEKKVVELLGSGNDVEKRLLVCIAIDIKFELINNEQIVRILDEINLFECKDNLLECYDEIVDKHEVFASNIVTKTKLQLVRVMKSTSFTNHYFNDLKLNGLFIEKEQLLDQIKRENLNQIYMRNRSLGKGNLVWATTLEELSNILDNSETPANDVIVRLGLSPEEPKDSIEYIYFEYPKDFGEELYQPCNFSNHWRDEDSFYISFKQSDGFGRTRSRVGDFYDKGMKETVHKSIDIPKYKYNIKYLGILDNFDKDISNFVNEAINRFEDEK